LSATTPLGFTEAVERVRTELKTEGFGVLCEIDVQATLKEKLGVDGGHVRLAVAVVDDDVAGQEHSQLGLGLERAMGERRVAGAEDHVLLALHSEPRLQGRLHVDLAEDAEALRLQLLANALDGVRVRERGGRAQGVATVDCRHASSRSRIRAFAALARCDVASGGSGKRSSR